MFGNITSDLLVSFGLAIDAADGDICFVFEFQLNGNTSPGYFIDAMDVGGKITIDDDSSA